MHMSGRIGCNWKNCVIGKHEVGNMNYNGRMLLEFCSRYQLLAVMSTMFQLKNSLKNTWQHLHSKHWHQIDPLLANTRAKQYITSTRVSTTADCFTDHKLFVCKCKFQKQCKKKGLKPPKKLDTFMTQERKEKLEQYFGEKLPRCSDEWEEFKALLQEAAEHIYDKKDAIE